MNKLTAEEGLNMYSYMNRMACVSSGSQRLTRIFLRAGISGVQYPARRT